MRLYAVSLFCCLLQLSVRVKCQGESQQALLDMILNPANFNNPEGEYPEWLEPIMRQRAEAQAAAAEAAGGEGGAQAAEGGSISAEGGTTPQPLAANETEPLPATQNESGNPNQPSNETNPVNTTTDSFAGPQANQTSGTILPSAGDPSTRREPQPSLKQPSSATHPRQDTIRANPQGAYSLEPPNYRREQSVPQFRHAPVEYRPPNSSFRYSSSQKQIDSWYGTGQPSALGQEGVSQPSRHPLHRSTNGNVPTETFQSSVSNPQYYQEPTHRMAQPNPRFSMNATPTHYSQLRTDRGPVHTVKEGSHVSANYFSSNRQELKRPAPVQGYQERVSTPIKQMPVPDSTYYNRSRGQLSSTNNNLVPGQTNPLLQEPYRSSRPKQSRNPHPQQQETHPRLKYWSTNERHPPQYQNNQQIGEHSQFSNQGHQIPQHGLPQRQLNVRQRYHFKEKSPTSSEWKRTPTSNAYKDPSTFGESHMTQRAAQTGGRQTNEYIYRQRQKGQYPMSGSHSQRPQRQDISSYENIRSTERLQTVNRPTQTNISPPQQLGRSQTDMLHHPNHAVSSYNNEHKEMRSGANHNIRLEQKGFPLGSTSSADATFRLSANGANGVFSGAYHSKSQKAFSRVPTERHHTLTSQKDIGNSKYVPHSQTDSLQKDVPNVSIREQTHHLNEAGYNRQAVEIYESQLANKHTEPTLQNDRFSHDVRSRSGGNDIVHRENVHSMTAAAQATNGRPQTAKPFYDPAKVQLQKAQMRNKLAEQLRSRLSPTSSNIHQVRSSQNKLTLLEYIRSLVSPRDRELRGQMSVRAIRDNAAMLKRTTLRDVLRGILTQPRTDAVVASSKPLPKQKYPQQVIRAERKAPRTVSPTRLQEIRKRIALIVYLRKILAKSAESNTGSGNPDSRNTRGGQRNHPHIAHTSYDYTPQVSSNTKSTSNSVHPSVGDYLKEVLATSGGSIITDLSTGYGENIRSVPNINQQHIQATSVTSGTHF